MQAHRILVLLLLTSLLIRQPVHLEADEPPPVVLNPIDNPDGDGDYRVTWFSPPIAALYLPVVMKNWRGAPMSLAREADMRPVTTGLSQRVYTLEEDDNPGFDSPEVAYTGPLMWVELSDKPEGVYYYRVKRDGTEWSNRQWVVVHVRSLACQSFAEEFTDTEYQDTENTTANWNTDDGILALWQTPLPSLPEARKVMAAVYASVTDEVYLLGGGSDTIWRFVAASGETSEVPGRLPSPIWRTSAAFVPETGKAYVFGGWGGGYSEEIVEFDPVASSVSVSSSRLPTSRTGTAAAYVPRSGKVYVFGGYDGDRLDEIVEFDPVAGTVGILAAKLPSARENTSAVYVPETGKVYVFGGSESFGDNLDEIIEFDPVGGTVGILAAKLPSAREKTSAVYVPETGKIYVFGGWGGGYSEEIVEFDPVASSVSILSSRLPTARSGTAAAYVPEAGLVYVFGGEDGATLSDIIQFDPIDGSLGGIGSVNRFPASLPSKRARTSAAYMPETGKVYVIGGDWSDYLNEIVEFGAEAGTAITFPVTLPSARSSTSAVYAPETSSIYIFGGAVSYGEYLDEIVEFDAIGGTASLLTVKLPSARKSTSSAYVPETGKVYVFGGVKREGYSDVRLDEIVEFDPVAGTVSTLSVKLPTPIEETSAAYVPGTGRVYIFGGYGAAYSDGIIEFDPVTSSVSLLAVKLPSARTATSAVYVPQTGTVYIFGGEESSTQYLAEIIEFDPASARVKLLSALLPYTIRGTSAVYVPPTGNAYVFGLGRWGVGGGIVEVGLGSYARVQQAQSVELDRWVMGVFSATLSADQILDGQTVAYALSNDGGAAWEGVVPDTDHLFSNPMGSDLRWRVTLHSDTTTSPLVEGLSIHFCPDTAKLAPAAPFFGPIANLDEDGYYRLEWSALPDASAYVVEESPTAAFTNTAVVFVGSGTDVWITRREVGTYYYRVRAWNSGGKGTWSRTQQVTATQRIASPQLIPIENESGGSFYSVRWDAVAPRVQYTLQRDTSPSFPSPDEAYQGGETHSNEVLWTRGTYYYRVKASDNGIMSDWSNIQSVEVSSPGPEAGDYTGSGPSVSFDVTRRQQVCNFDIGLSGGCRIQPSCTDIAEGSFGWLELESGSSRYFITGQFMSPTHASGTYWVSMCQGTLFIPALEGTWEASK